MSIDQEGWRFDRSQMLWQYWHQGKVIRTVTAIQAMTLPQAEWWSHMPELWGVRRAKEPR